VVIGLLPGVGRRWCDGNLANTFRSEWQASGPSLPLTLRGWQRGAEIETIYSSHQDLLSVEWVVDAAV